MTEEWGQWNRIQDPGAYSFENRPQDLQLHPLTSTSRAVRGELAASREPRLRLGPGFCLRLEAVRNQS